MWNTLVDSQFTLNQSAKQVGGGDTWSPWNEQAKMTIESISIYKPVKNTTLWFISTLMTAITTGLIKELRHLSLSLWSGENISIDQCRHGTSHSRAMSDSQLLIVGYPKSKFTNWESSQKLNEVLFMPTNSKLAAFWDSFISHSLESILCDKSV